MAKRKVQFSEDIQFHKSDESDVQSDEQKLDSELAFGKKFKHTLDSDEEDDEVIENSYNVLDSDQIDGQEDATIERDGEVKITPFNMKEELESGHFDKDGNYIFDKTEEIRDNWLDHIDWVAIKDQDINDDKDKSDEESDPKTNIDLNDVYKQMTELLEPKESVEKAIQRLGKSCGKSKSSDRWKRSKDNDNTSEEQNQFKEKLMKLSSLADLVLQTGDMDVYQKTYEHLVFTLKKSSDSKSCDSDMFSDDFIANKQSNGDENTDSDNEVKWEFKWEDKESAPVFGPHTSHQMLNWVNEGYFESGVYVRQIGKTDSHFYSSKRIDFDLFT